jgi:hypothetical protein
MFTYSSTVQKQTDLVNALHAAKERVLHMQ